jgi:hypothetical protein
MQIFTYLQNPIIFSIVIGIFVACYTWLEDSFTNQVITNKTKYVRAFIITTIAINVVHTYVNKSLNMGGAYQQSYSVGSAPF